MMAEEQKARGLDVCNFCHRPVRFGEFSADDYRQMQELFGTIPDKGYRLDSGRAICNLCRGDMESIVTEHPLQ